MKITYFELHTDKHPILVTYETLLLLPIKGKVLCGVDSKFYIVQTEKKNTEKRLTILISKKSEYIGKRTYGNFSGDMVGIYITDEINEDVTSVNEDEIKNRILNFHNHICGIDGLGFSRRIRKYIMALKDKFWLDTEEDVVK